MAVLIIDFHSYIGSIIILVDLYCLQYYKICGKEKFATIKQLTRSSRNTKDNVLTSIPYIVVCKGISYGIINIIICGAINDTHILAPR